MNSTNQKYKEIKLKKRKKKKEKKNINNLNKSKHLLHEINKVKRNESKVKERTNQKILTNLKISSPWNKNQNNEKQRIKKKKKKGEIRKKNINKFKDFSYIETE